MSALRFDVSDTVRAGAWCELTLERRLRHERHDVWSTDVASIPVLGEVVASRRGEAAEEQVVARREGAVRVKLFGGYVHVDVACESLADVDALFATVRHAIPPRPKTEEREARVDFWSNGAHGAVRQHRRIATPSWDEVRGNYSPATAAAVGALMEGPPPPHHGRLVLWHGPPGTGKTTALRALAWEWRERVGVHCVTDPEALLQDPAYMQRLVAARPGARTRLLVLEDAGELLAPDAKHQAGQGLARLLNLTDGLLGSGLPAVVLITGNEPLHRLHPALSRPGRCAAEIGFERFDAPAAARWLAERAEGPVDAPDGSMSLAELYARLAGRPVATERRVGFATA